MCGLFAVFNSNAGAPKALENYVRDCLITGAVRGADSTGIFNITKKTRDVSWHKLPVNGTYFAQDRATQYFIDAADFKAITVGHLRKATAGNISLHNAHPFITPQDANGDYIIGVHNGSLPDWRTRTGGNDYDVDSEWALNLIFQKGMDAFKEFKGAFAFIWYDTRTPDIINVARNKDRTLYYQWLGDGKKDADGKEGRGGSLVMASEHGQLSWVASRNALPMGDKVFIIEEGYHYSFNIDDVTKFTKELYPVPVVLPAIVMPIVPYVPDHYEGRDAWKSRDFKTPKERIIEGVKNAMLTPAVDEKKKADGDISAVMAADRICSIAEVNMAKAEKEFGEEFVFTPDSWDHILKEVVGTVSYDYGHGHYDAVDACFRGLPETLGMAMARGDYLSITGKVAGMITDSRHVSTFILHSPALKLRPIEAKVISQGMTH